MIIDNDNHDHACLQCMIMMMIMIKIKKAVYNFIINSKNPVSSGKLRTSQAPCGPGQALWGNGIVCATTSDCGLLTPA